MKPKYLTLPKDEEYPRERLFEVSLYETSVDIERPSNSLYDYEQTSLTKQQAMALANAIISFYQPEKA